MTIRRRPPLCLAAVCACLGLLVPASLLPAQQPTTEGDKGYAVTYSPHATTFSCNMNMGPTGATVWMRGYQFVVTSIQQQSPAHGRLMLGDVITAANGTTLGPAVDHRMTLGNAIGEAQATGEPLTLTVLRDGKQRVVEIPLPKLGAYAPTWPADCEKSGAILESALQSLLSEQLPDGHVPSDDNFGLFGTGLLFLASADSKYLDAGRRAAYKASRIDYDAVGYENWVTGYGGILMAEYFLATGDDTVLPKLRHVAERVARGQMLCGSWGHNSPGAGYGALNQTGLGNAIMLVLAKECGIKVDEVALNNALEFFGRYAEIGAIPYGDHKPGRSLDDNGKVAAAAVLFHLAGDKVKSDAFAASVAESFWLRERGHTGGYFSIMWGPLGAALAGEQKLQRFLDYQKWYYDLGRKWTGAITMLPYREALTRFDGNSYIGSGGKFSTGAFGLLYALPRQHLRITGAPKSVFTAKLAGPLRQARDLYLVRDWQGCDKVLDQIKPATLEADSEKYWYQQLVSARELARQSIDRVLLEIDSNIEGGASYRASQQFEALKQCYGESADPRFAALEERFEDGTVAWHVREGEKFYDRYEQMLIATVITWTPQGRMAREMLRGMPSARIAIWEPLSPTSSITPQQWRTLLIQPDESLPDGWYKPGFDDSAWRKTPGIYTRFIADAKDKAPNGPIAARRVFVVKDTSGTSLRVRLRTVRRALTQVYLNGELIVDVERGQRGGYADIKLQDSVFGLLREGENVLAVTCNQQGRAGNHLDVSLEINRSGYEQRHLPIERYDWLDANALPDVDTALHVADTARAYEQSLAQQYNAKPIAALLAEMGSTIPYYRSLAENALVNAGLPGIEPAIARITDPDWKVRSSAISIIRKALGDEQQASDPQVIAVIDAQLPAVTKAISDPHFWVRAQACAAAGAQREKAKSATPALVKAAGDPRQWVREAALRAVKQVGADAATIVAATQSAIAVRNSAYGISRAATQVADDYADKARTKLAIYVQILRNPPEGGGGRLLSQIIDKACELDPQGTVMIPVLIEAAADKTHLSRQRGGPRAKAIQALGSYGPKAAAAASVLEQILASSDKAEIKVHEPATLALAAIRRDAE